MKKITLIVIAILFGSLTAFAQFTFPSAGPVTTLDATNAVTVPINDIANAAGVSPGSYISFTVTCDWVNLDNAWSNEERLSVVTSAGASTPIAPSNGLATTASVNGLTFSGTIVAAYDPDTNGLLQLSLTRTFNSDAQLSNIVVTIFEPAPPLCSGTSSFVFTENFEGNPPTGWTGIGTSGANGTWRTTLPNGNSSNTGPNIPYTTGGGRHLEYEASGNTTLTASAISPAIDLTSITEGAELSFYLHAYGSTMGTLNVGVSNSGSGGPFTTVYSQSGQTQTSATAAWSLIEISLFDYLGDTIHLRFSHTGAGGFQGDMAIDFVRVEACDPPTCTPPTTQATTDTTTNINSLAGSATLNWTAGADGDNILIVMREGSAVDTDPIIGNSYTSNSVFGTPAAELGTGNYVIYDGLKTTETVNITGLNQGTTYHFALYQYTAAGFCYNISENVGNFTMPCAIPSNVTALSATPGNLQINLNWTNPSCFDEILIIAREVSVVTASPTGDGSAYTANSYFSVGTEITTDEFIVYKGTSNSANITNLINGATYHFTVFTRLGTTWSAGISVNAIPALDYCDVLGDLTYLTSITLVDFGSISNISGQDPDDGYTDFTNISTTVTKGTDEDITINVNTDGNFLVYSFVWIDWNQDGDFDDAGEAYDLGFAANTPNGPTNLSGQTISIPTSAAIGETRMRVVCQYNDPPPALVQTLEPCLGSNDGEVEDYTINVTGSVTYTYNNGWSENPNGIATSNDDIIIASGDATIDTNTTCNTITINAGAGLIINNGIVLNATNGLDLESTSTSYSSLILDGFVFGTLSYDRHVNINGSGITGSNDLISAPLTGQPFNAFATANPNILNNGTLYLFGPYDKVAGEYVTYAGTATSTLDPGIGYRAGSSDNGTFTFTGTANNGVITNNITNSGATEFEWNLVGNPYPSYINVQQFLSHDVGGVANIQLFNPPTAAIYGYDGNALDDWVIYNLATTTASTVIAPGQGFFVSCNVLNETLYDLEFSPDIRTTGTSDDFINGRNAELIYLKLNASTSSNSIKTEFYFNNNSSLGFDLGYDAKVWGNAASDFAMYSHLVEDNNGVDMAIQSLNISNLTDVTIPLGVNANQGEQITFSIADMTLPSAVNVYLDDAVTNTTTLLNNSDYIITPATALSGTGRFFLRTSEDALSTIENSLNTLNIFVLNSSKELIINGKLKENSVTNIYDIQGRNVLSVNLDNTSLENRLDVSSLSLGVYIVNVQNNTQQKTQKVIIK